MLTRSGQKQPYTDMYQFFRNIVTAAWTVSIVLMPAFLGWVTNLRQTSNYVLRHVKESVIINTIQHIQIATIADGRSIDEHINRLSIKF